MFGTSSPLAIGTPSATSVVSRVIVKVNTPFDGTAPLLDIGVSGTTDLYMDQTEIDLTVAGTYIVDLYAANASVAIIGTYAADSSTAGDADILVKYSVV